MNTPPDTLLEKDVVGIMAEATLSIARRYDCLGDGRGYVHLMCSADPKVLPLQMVRIFKTYKGRVCFEGNRRLRKSCGERNFGRMSIMSGQ